MVIPNNILVTSWRCLHRALLLIHFSCALLWSYNKARRIHRETGDRLLITSGRRRCKLLRLWYATPIIHRWDDLPTNVREQLAHRALHDIS